MMDLEEVVCYGIGNANFAVKTAVKWSGIRETWVK